MKVPLQLLDDFITDPVMAAETFMNVELDDYQRYRLRFLWWIPMTIDSSGVSSAKTVLNWIYVNLRAMFLGHRVAVVFQNMEVGKSEFWPYYYKIGVTNPFFLRETVFFKDTGKLGEKNTGASMSWNFHSGGSVYMRAPGHSQDAKGWASMRFHDMLIEEWLEVESSGDSIDKQLITRPTMATFNDYNPIWTNHIKFSGHAGSPASKGYKRYRRLQKAISQGSQRHGLISFCFKDYSDRFKQYAKPEALKEVKINSGEDAYIRQVLGIWQRDGSSFYDDKHCSRCLDNVPVQLARPDGPFIDAGHHVDLKDVYYFHGRDTASSEASHADYSSDVVLRAIECKEDESPTVTLGKYHYRLQYVYAKRYQGLKFKHFSGLFYWLHSKFHFTKSCMDPGGGGEAIYQWYQEEIQDYGQGPFRVTPVCTIEDPDSFHKEPIVTFFKRGSECDRIFPRKFPGDEGLLDACHRKWRTAWNEKYFKWPQKKEDFDPVMWRKYKRSEKAIHDFLDIAYSEIIEIRNLTRPDGTPLLNKRNFLLFASRVKKDMGYTALYAYIAFLAWHSDRQNSDYDSDDIAV